MPQKTSPLIDMDAVGRQCFPRDQDKKHRRMVANSNERRRMQSINAGFEMLKNLIRPQDADKLSKASVLQQAVDHIKTLEDEKSFLLAENSRLKRLLYDFSHKSNGYHDDDAVVMTTKRRKMDTESSDEGVGMTSEDATAVAIDDAKKEMEDVRQRLDYEKRLRCLLEQQQLHLVTGSYVNKQVDSFVGETEHGSSRVRRQSGQTENFALRGSLEAIVEAIQHLEGVEQDSVVVETSRTSCTKSPDVVTNDGDDSNFCVEGSLPLPASELMRVVAAAEALQFIRERHEKQSTYHPCILQPFRSSSSSTSSSSSSYSNASNSCHIIGAHPKVFFRSS